MAINQKAVKVINKILDAGFTDEKAISAMTMDDILSIQGITVADIALINELQKSIKANRVISFLTERTLPMWTGSSLANCVTKCRLFSRILSVL